MDAKKQIEVFRALHESGCFVVPNPWDRGSAIALASLGFKALATSSAGLAFTLGLQDSPLALSREMTLANIRDIVSATSLPVNADFQAGYGETAEEVAESVRLCVETGAAGLSIEDASATSGGSLYGFDAALDRVRAARNAINTSGRGVVLTARCEAYLVDHPRPLETVLERLIAFADAGADCLYAPGLQTPEEIKRVVAAVAPKAVNVLVTDPGWMTVASLGDLGVRRVSVGSALARAAWGGFLLAAREIAASGSFGVLEGAESFDLLNNLFARDRC